MRTAIFVKATLVAVALCTCAAAADGRLNGPVSAVVYDEASRSARSVVGIPGSAYVGAALADGMDLAAFAPNGLAGLYVKTAVCT